MLYEKVEGPVAIRTLLSFSYIVSYIVSYSSQHPNFALPVDSYREGLQLVWLVEPCCKSKADEEDSEASRQHLVDVTGKPL